jgi:DNA-binding NarL/FixJ family response regulator
MTVRVLLVDDHPLVRTGLRTLVEAECDLEVVAEADNRMRAISAARKLRPDVMVTDLLLPDVNGVAVTER